MTTRRIYMNGDLETRDDLKEPKFRRPSPSAMGGAAFGGVIGSALGPLGAAAGAVIGGIVGEVVERHYDPVRASANGSVRH